jgi:AcrR family transcriptional regulator
MARPKEFNQDSALRKAVRLFSQQGFAATSTDDLMRAMHVGRQSMYDTFGDKRALFLKALEMDVTESVHAIGAELEKTDSALSAIQDALVTFAERGDLSSAEGCMGLNAISEFGQRDPEVTRITRNAARAQRKALMLTLLWPPFEFPRACSRRSPPCLQRSAAGLSSPWVFALVPDAQVLPDSMDKALSAAIQHLSSGKVAFKVLDQKPDSHVERSPYPSPKENFHCGLN